MLQPLTDAENEQLRTLHFYMGSYPKPGKVMTPGTPESVTTFSLRQHGYLVRSDDPSAGEHREPVAATVSYTVTSIGVNRYHRLYDRAKAEGQQLARRLP